MSLVRVAAGREIPLSHVCIIIRCSQQIYEYGFIADLTPPHTPHFTLHHTLTLGPFSATKIEIQLNPLRVTDFFMTAYVIILCYTKCHDYRKEYAKRRVSTGNKGKTVSQLQRCKHTTTLPAPHHAFTAITARHRANWSQDICQTIQWG
jgi:hypothetical protein